MSGELDHERSDTGERVLTAPHHHHVSHPDNPLTAEHSIDFHNFTDADGDPLGGSAWGMGFAIAWQHGPTRSAGGPPTRNGAFVEEVIEAAKARLEFYQSTRFVSHENANALAHLAAALSCLRARTAERIARGVEGRNEL